MDSTERIEGKEKESCCITMDNDMTGSGEWISAKGMDIRYLQMVAFMRANTCRTRCKGKASTSGLTVRHMKESGIIT